MTGGIRNPARWLAATSLAFTLVLASSSAHADDDGDATPAAKNDDAPLRRGLTIEAGAGVGGTHFVRDGSGGSAGGLGFAAPAIGVGAFASRYVSFLLRVSGTSFTPEGGSQLLGNTLYHLSVQLWPTDRLMFGIGPGVSAFGRGVYSVSNPQFGFGASLRAGYALVATKNCDVRLAIDAIPARIEKTTSFATALMLEWQYY